MNTHRRYKFLIFLSVALGLATVLAWAVYGWYHQQQITKAHQLNKTQLMTEMEMIENIYTLVNQMHTDQKIDLESIKKIDQPDELFVASQKLIKKRASDLNQLIDSYGIYLDQQRAHNQELASFQNEARFLLGQSSRQVNELYTKRQDYYKYSIEDAEAFLAEIILYKEHLELQQDIELFLFILAKTKGFQSLTSLSDYQGQAASLSRYRSYLLPQPELLKKYYPHSVELLEKKAAFLQDFDSVMSSVAQNEFESAAYKLQRMSATFNLVRETDVTDTFKSFKPRDMELSKESTNAMLSIHSVLQSAPFADLEPSSKQLTACMLYLEKIAFFSELKDNTPKATSFEDLLEKMKAISPNTQEIDSQYIQSGILSTASDDNGLQYTCSLSTGQSYSLSIPFNEDSDE